MWAISLGHDQKIKAWAVKSTYETFVEKKFTWPAEFYFRETVRWFDKYVLFAAGPWEVLESEKFLPGSWKYYCNRGQR